MKHLINALFLSLLIVSCGKKNDTGKVTRDCTGTYVTIDSKDYQVCNFESLAAYSENEAITIEYEHITGCLATDTMIVCELYHKNEGFIEIISVE